MEDDQTLEHLKFLLDHAYGMQNVQAISPVEDGEWNRVFNIEAGDTSILRISHRRKDETQLAFELDVMTHARAHLSVVPCIRQARVG